MNTKIVSLSNSPYPTIKPLDVIVFSGEWWYPPAWAIMWRSLSVYSHCVVSKDSFGNVWDATSGGILNHNVFLHYPRRKAWICRPNFKYDKNIIIDYINKAQLSGKGYDYIAWLGFATCIKSFEDDSKWFCSELPYWMFQENGYILTNHDLKFPFPSLFIDNPLFDIVWKGSI